MMISKWHVTSFCRVLGVTELLLKHFHLILGLFWQKFWKFGVNFKLLPSSLFLTYRKVSPMYGKLWARALRKNRSHFVKFSSFRAISNLPRSKFIFYCSKSYRSNDLKSPWGVRVGSTEAIGTNFRNSMFLGQLNLRWSNCESRLKDFGCIRAISRFLSHG